jgi:uncharacterized protein (TIGR00255 family)
MTGFGRGASAPDGARALVTVQGWNHRFADIVLRLPDELRAVESELRNRVAARVSRGRCEVVVRLEDPRATAAGRAIDREALTRFLADSADLVGWGRIDGRITLGDLARSPFLVAAAGTAETGPELAAQVTSALDVAVEEYDAARIAEGGRLEQSISRLLDALVVLVERIATQREGLGERLREGLARRIEAVLPGGAEALPPERLAQEIALLVDRYDVHEELERLRGHVAGFRDAVAAPGPHGRKLDFLVQEILRELNTLGSKSRDLDVTRSVVEAKVLNEQLRELVQNVE